MRFMMFMLDGIAAMLEAPASVTPRTTQRDRNNEV